MVGDSNVSVVAIDDSCDVFVGVVDVYLIRSYGYSS